MTRPPISLPDIQSAIPHRGPMLLIDRVIELVPGERVVAQKAVTYGEWCYRGMDDQAEPAAYAYPIGLVLESFNQACAMLASHAPPEVLILGGYTDVEFGADVYPGDVLRHNAHVARTIDGIQLFHGRTFVGEKCVLTVGHSVLARRSTSELHPLNERTG